MLQISNPNEPSETNEFIESSELIEIRKPCENSKWM